MTQNFKLLELLCRERARGLKTPASLSCPQSLPSSSEARWQESPWMYISLQGPRTGRRKTESRSGEANGRQTGQPEVFRLLFLPTEPLHQVKSNTQCQYTNQMIAELLQWRKSQCAMPSTSLLPLWQHLSRPTSSPPPKVTSAELQTRLKSTFANH